MQIKKCEDIHTAYRNVTDQREENLYITDKFNYILSMTSINAVLELSNSLFILTFHCLKTINKRSKCNRNYNLLFLIWLSLFNLESPMRP